MSNHFISLAAAKEMTKRYRESLDTLVTSEYKGSMLFSETFDAQAIQAILKQTDCVSFRTYFGMKEDKTVCVIHIGVDAAGNDIINSLNGNGADVIVELGKVCPPYCNDQLL